MDTIIFVVYVVVFIYLITLLVISVRKKSIRYWVVEYLSEVLAIIGAIVTMCYFNNLPFPRDDFFPGLKYLGEILFSMGAAILYTIIFIVSIVCGATIYVKEKTKS